jgi:arsenate reductase (thioredoxin)
VTTVLFACIHNAGRSQMAAAFFSQMANPEKAAAISAGTQPGERVHPEVVRTMRELGIDLSDVRPRLLTPEMGRTADLLVTMGCGDECPFIAGVERQDWELADPKGKPADDVRQLRDDIKRRVTALVTSRGWA